MIVTQSNLVGVARMSRLWHVPRADLTRSIVRWRVHIRLRHPLPDAVSSWSRRRMDGVGSAALGIMFGRRSTIIHKWLLVSSTIFGECLVLATIREATFESSWSALVSDGRRDLLR